MTLTLSEANSFAPATKDHPATGVPASPEKSTFAILAKRFWDYTEAVSKTNRKSFEGLL